MDVAARLACADSSFPRLSHAAALAVIGDLGIHAVDVCVFPAYAHTDPAAVRADPEGTAGEVKRRLEENELEVADVFLILGFEERAVNHPDPAIRADALEYFERAVEFAALLDSPGISIIPGMPFEGVDPDASHRLAASELQRRAEIAGESGLALAIEPHYQSIVERVDRTLELLELAPDVKLALDYSHFIYQGIDQEEVDMLIPRSRHMHLRQAAPGKMQVPTREGTIDFKRLLGAVDAAGYPGYLTLEYQCDDWLECHRVDCISETAELRDLLLA